MRAVFILLLLASALSAAPMKPPPPLAEADIVGSWDYTWGAGYAGPVTFGVDGTFTMHSAKLYPIQWVGRWWYADGVLVLLYFTVGDDNQRNPIEHNVRVKWFGGKIAGSNPESESILTMSRK